MKRNNMAFHTLDPDVAIGDLIEIHQQRKKRWTYESDRYCDRPLSQDYENK